MSYPFISDISAEALGNFTQLAKADLSTEAFGNFSQLAKVDNRMGADGFRAHQVFDNCYLFFVNLISSR